MSGLNGDSAVIGYTWHRSGVLDTSSVWLSCAAVCAPGYHVICLIGLAVSSVEATSNVMDLLHNMHIVGIIQS